MALEGADSDVRLRQRAHTEAGHRLVGGSLQQQREGDEIGEGPQRVHEEVFPAGPGKIFLWSRCSELGQGTELGRDSGSKITNLKGVFPKMRAEALGVDTVDRQGRIGREHTLCLSL